MRTKVSPVWLAIVAASCLLICVSTANAQQPRIGLRNLANNKVGFWDRFGCSVRVDKLQNSDGVYPGFIASEFSMVEPENELKPAAIWQGPGSYNTGQADWLLGTPGSTGWAQANNVNVRGHVLVYAGDRGYRIPDWLCNNEASISPTQAQNYLKDYIHYVVGRYKGKIKAWDVVNECIGGNTGNAYNMVNDFWYRKLGKWYVLYACQYAHEADPNVELNINDYGVESTGQKATDLFNLVQWLRSNNNFDGTPIRVGVGMQYHFNLGDSINPGDGHYAVAQNLQNNGIPFTITEIDAWVPVTDPKPNGQGLNPSNTNDLNTTAAIYRGALRLAESFSLCQGFQTWGATDKYSWIPDIVPNGGAATITDQYYNPKLAYWQLQEELGRNIANGTYSIGSRLATGQVLDVWSGGIQMYGYGGGANQKWSVTWNGNGTYRLSPTSSLGTALDTYNTLGNPGGIQTYNWWGGANQEWVITPTNSGFFRISPRTAVWRGLGTNTGAATNTTPLGIWDFSNVNSQQWQFQPR